MWRDEMRLIIYFTLILGIAACTPKSNPPAVQEISPTLPEDHPPVSGMPGGLPPGNKVDSLYAGGNLYLGSRYYVASIFRRVFEGTTLTQQEQYDLDDEIDVYILNYPTVLGGAPNHYSTRGFLDYRGANCGIPCWGEIANFTPMNIPSTPARASVITKACRRFIDNNAFFKEALNKIGKDYSLNPTFDQSKIGDIYGLFYIDKEINADLKTAINTAVTKVGTNGGTNLDKWRQAYLMICESPFWQLL